MPKKACRDCRYLTDKNKCPICNSEQLSESWKGKLIILDAENSLIANKVGIKKKGEYAIKI